jgi:DNA-binding beta-propeller fold protein YncE
MEFSRVRRVLMTTLSFVLAGCAGLRVAPTGVVPQAVTTAVHGKSWMLPEASGEALIYLSARNGSGISNVYVLSYTTGKLVGDLTGFGGSGGLCVDKSGDVWVVDFGRSEVDEYAHGGTSRIASLSVPGPAPYGCAVDPATGNLAVTYSDFDGNIAVYPNAEGTPVTYSDGLGPTFFYCTYDNASNLLISDDWGLQKPHLYELPHGSSALTEVSLGKNARFRGQIQIIQWDGQAFAYGGSRVSRKGSPIIYQLAISRSEAKISGTTHLLRGRGPGQFWVQGNSVVQRAGVHIGVWDYPGGGKPTKLFAMPVRGTPSAGIAISEAPSSK